MNNKNILVTGMTGSGKTNFSKYLLKRTPRAIVLDRKREYQSGAIFSSFEEARSFWLRHMWDDFHMTIRGDTDEHYIAWIDIVSKAQEELGLPPLGLFLEEATFYSNSYNVDDVINRLYTQGRHGRISVVSNTQRVTQVHPITRDQCEIWVAFRVRSFPTAIRDVFPSQDLEKMPDLETLFPDEDPECGVHYLTDQGCERSDVVRAWTVTVSGGEASSH